MMGRETFQNTVKTTISEKTSRIICRKEKEDYRPAFCVGSGIAFGGKGIYQRLDKWMFSAPANVA